MRLSRRQMIATLGAAAIPAKGLAWSARQRVLVDRGLPHVARHLRQGAVAIDRTGDAVRQLQGLLAQSSSPIAGLTSGSDMLVARGSAREHRRKFALVAQHGAIFQWTIAGECTGKFRNDKNDKLFSPDGTSTISREDYAPALINEVVAPQHHRERCIMGY